MYPADHHLVVCYSSTARRGKGSEHEDPGGSILLEDWCTGKLETQLVEEYASLEWLL